MTMSLSDIGAELNIELKESMDYGPDMHCTRKHAPDIQFLRVV